MKQIGLLKIHFIKLRLKGNQEILIYKAKTSKTGIRLINQNYPFLDGKVLPNSVLSIKKFYACALEYAHNIFNFCKFILWYSNYAIFER